MSTERGIVDTVYHCVCDCVAAARTHCLLLPKAACAAEADGHCGGAAVLRSDGFAAGAGFPGGNAAFDGGAQGKEG